MGDDLKKVVNSLADGFREENLARTREELIECYYFKWSCFCSIACNLYEFTQCIENYRALCEQWEEHHNGHVCVVERVRDKYLMPKVEEFLFLLDKYQSYTILREAIIKKRDVN